MSEPEDDEGTDLLTSPLQSTGVGKLFVIGGPVGLAIAILLSLRASWMHVRHSVVAQVEPQWVAGERLAVRARLVSETMTPVKNLESEAWVEQGGQRHDLPDPELGGSDDLVQATFDVPPLSLGQAQLHLALSVPGADPREEVIPIEVVEQRTPKQGTLTVSASTLQRGDDSDAQLDPMRIDIRPDGRVLSEFDNTFYVRVLHPDARPYVGEVEVALAYGELGGRTGDPEKPVVLARQATDALGLVKVGGRLTSEVLRLEARVLSTEGHVRLKRRMRFVSYAGAVSVAASTRVAPPSAAFDVEALAMSARRPTHVDVHDANGTWIDTMLFFGQEEPRPWEHSALPPGILQLEAYEFTNDPGESTALHRVQIVSGDATRGESLPALITAYRRRLDAPRVELDYDPKLDAAYLAWIQAAKLDPAAVRSARAWLLGTLPVEVHGPPTALSTRERDFAEMSARQQKWTVGLRIFLLGGGGLFLALMTLAMMRSHANAARSTMNELKRLTTGQARADAAMAVERAKRQALVRGLGVIAVMAGALVLTTILLERLLWVF